MIEVLQVAHVILAAGVVLHDADCKIAEVATRLDMGWEHFVEFGTGEGGVVFFPLATNIVAVSQNFVVAAPLVAFELELRLQPQCGVSRLRFGRVPRLDHLQVGG